MRGLRHGEAGEGAQGTVAGALEPPFVADLNPAIHSLPLKTSVDTTGHQLS